MAAVVIVVIYCTDRGRHRRRDLYALTGPPGGLYLMRLVYGPAPSAGNDAPVYDTIADGASGVAVALTDALSCPLCRRKPLMSTRRWRRLYDGLAASGVSDVDMSARTF